MYGWSILHCLPAALAEDPVEATGTVLRAPVLARWAAAAGFTGFEVLDIDNPFWRFYRLGDWSTGGGLADRVEPELS